MLHKDSDQAPGDVAVIEPPENKMRKLIICAAKLVSRGGKEVEKFLLTHNPYQGSSFSFLNSSDPYHAFYQQQLALHLAQYPDGPPPGFHPDIMFPTIMLGAQSGGTTSVNHPPPMFTSSFVFSYPTREERATVKLTAQFVARYGMCFLLALRSSASMHSRFHFVNSDDDGFRDFFRQAAAYSKVLAYCEKPEDDPAFFIDCFLTCLRGETVKYHMDLIDLHSGIDYFASMENVVIPEPSRGITLKEIDTMKLTAQFVARYGADFWLAVTRGRKVDSRFEFVNEGGRGFDYFNLLVAAYSKVLAPSENLRDGTARADTVVNEFLSRVNLFETLSVQRNAMEKAMVLGHFVGSVDKFTRVDDADCCSIMPLPEHLSVMRTQILSGMLVQPSMGMMQGPFMT